MIIHQMLHGYNNGHRLISGSIDSDNITSKLIQTLSDISGQGLNPPEYGYITGYPLNLMKQYAFACTWPAPEMARPGCVWTHTLLIDFADLAVIKSTSIMDLFMRPSTKNDIVRYSKPFIFEDSGKDMEISEYEKATGIVIDKLYEFPDKCIFVIVDEKFPSIDIVFFIWLRQWPKLRRKFRFCTWSPNDRSETGEPFDLQFVPSARMNYLKTQKDFSGIYVEINNENIIEKKWIDEIKGINSSNETGLRNFIWKYGSAANNGRFVYKPLINIAEGIANDENIDLIEKEYSKLKNEVELQNSLIHVIIDNKIENNISDLRIVMFIIKYLDEILKNANKSYVNLVFNAIWNISPISLIDQISIIKYRNEFIEFAINKISPEEMVEYLSNKTELFVEIACRDISLLYSEKIWKINKDLTSKLLKSIKNENIEINKMLDCIYYSRNIEILDVVIQYYHELIIVFLAKKLCSHSLMDAQINEKWLSALSKYPKMIMKHLENEVIEDMRVLEKFSNIIPYNYISENKYDEWLIAIKSNNILSKKITYEFGCYLLARAFSGVSPECTQLIELAFDIVHKDILANNIYNRNWEILGKELPKLPFWEDWDNGKKLRIGVIDIYAGKNIEVNKFISVSKDKNTIYFLLSDMARNAKYKQYFKRLVEYIKNNNIKENKEIQKILSGMSLLEYF